MELEDNTIWPVCMWIYGQMEALKYSDEDKYGLGKENGVIIQK